MASRFRRPHRGARRTRSPTRLATAPAAATEFTRSADEIPFAGRYFASDVPNRNTHVTAGVIAGAVAALYCSRDEPAEHRAVEVLGGMLGGYVGGRLPDLFDPPTNPLHRSFAHGGLAVGTVALAQLDEWRRACRQSAADCAAAGRGLDEFLNLMLAGFLTGLQAGYASHLALDMFTPAGLPLLGR